MAIQVYNTLTRRKEPFTPREPGKVRIYVCGLTPYDVAHLGHLRPAVVWAAIRNYLAYKGYEVTLVQNFTDVDDKIIQRAAETGRDPLELSAAYARDYLDCLDRMGIHLADQYPRVSQHMDDIIHLVEQLVEKGHAYVVDGDVYFDVKSFPEYGKLSNQRLSDLEAGARISVDERKRNAMDFALWKAAKPGEPAWDSPWGKGRPGWHIECSAMSLKYLGFGFDFHGGGLDLVFPHHENEIAQSEAAQGGSPFVRYWLHNGLVNVKSEKMSKSLGNFTAARALLDRVEPAVLKFYFLTAHYRSAIEFDEASLEEAQRGWERLQQAADGLAPWRKAAGPQSDAPQDLDSLPAGDEASAPGGEVAQLLRRAAAAAADAGPRFEEAMDDDFNTARAIAVLFDLAREVNPLLRYAETHGIRPEAAGPAAAPESPAVAAALGRAAEVLWRLGGDILGVLREPGAARAPAAHGAMESTLEGLVELALELRQQARTRKEWATADRIRDRLRELGIEVEDTPSGPRWKRAR